MGEIGQQSLFSIQPLELRAARTHRMLLQYAPEKCRYAGATSQDKSALPSEQLGLSDVAKNQLRHLEHADTVFAIEHLFEPVVCFDKGLIFGVLQIVPADVVPELARDIGAGQRFISHHRSEFFVRLHRLHKGRAGLAFRFRFGCGFGHKLEQARVSRSQ